MKNISAIKIENHQREKLEEFETHIQPIMERIYRTALIMTKNPRKAEELVQETFSNAWTEYRQGESGINFKSWMSRILLSTFVNGYQSRDLKLRPLTVKKAFSENISKWEEPKDEKSN